MEVDKQTPSTLLDANVLHDLMSIAGAKPRSNLMPNQLAAKRNAVTKRRAKNKAARRARRHNQ